MVNKFHKKVAYFIKIALIKRFEAQLNTFGQSIERHHFVGVAGQIVADQLNVTGQNRILHHARGQPIV